jgi:hypothetical protein
MKELFTQYQQGMTGSNADLIDDEYHFQQWVESLPSVSNPSHITHSIFSDNDGWTPELETQFWAEQPPEPFATDIELAELNDRIQVKYSDMDIEMVLEKVLGDANSLIDEIKNELYNLNNIRNGYFD